MLGSAVCEHTLPITIGVHPPPCEAAPDTRDSRLARLICPVGA